MIGFPNKKTDKDPTAPEERSEELLNRKKRFRILVCLDGSDEAYAAVRLAARIAKTSKCDIILLYVRPLDQGLNSGGLQVRVARQNMLEWGLELPGLQYLKRGLEILKECGHIDDTWSISTGHTDVFGDPLGDNKIVHESPDGALVVLKLKTSFKISSGILDQYELGPYNLTILGHPRFWHGRIRSRFRSNIVQEVALMSPSSVLTYRHQPDRSGFLIHINRSIRAPLAAQQAAVLAHNYGQPITLVSTAKSDSGEETAIQRVENVRQKLEEMNIKIHNTLTPKGEPKDVLVELGQEFKYIAVADSGKSQFKRFVEGSVAFDVMGRADTSVLNIR